METKNCERCGTLFSKPTGYSQQQWTDRRYCCRSCGAKSWQRTSSSGVCTKCGDLAAKRTREKCERCYNQDRYLARREHRLATNRAWREANPDYYKQERLLVAARQRAWAANFGGLRDEVLSRDGQTCQQCGVTGKTGQAGSDLCIHHVDGDHGHNVLENLLVLCNRCHAKTHATQGDYFGQTAA